MASPPLPNQPRPPAADPVWRLGRRILPLSRPLVMAILNLTPDSFSDGGSYPTVGAAVARAAAAAAEGAEILDLGGESTRPGADPVDAAEQGRRILPVLRAIRADRAFDRVVITVDTTLAAVAEAALDAGADGVNDVSAGEDDPAMLPLVAARGAGLVLMHRLRRPAADSYSDRYVEAPVYPGGVVAGVRRFLEDRCRAAAAAGMAPGAVAVDPGLGFGKTVEQNLELIAAGTAAAPAGYPLVSGISRKSFTARAAGLPPETPPRDRAAASVGLSVAHLAAGARIFRVHDVAMHAAALRAAWAAAEQPGGRGGS